VFFDSFGRTPEEWGEEFKDFMDAHVARYDHFDTQIQSNDTKASTILSLKERLKSNNILHFISKNDIHIN
jgi:hypothetical protein